MKTSLEIMYKVYPHLRVLVEEKVNMAFASGFAVGSIVTTIVTIAALHLGV